MIAAGTVLQGPSARLLIISDNGKRASFARFSDSKLPKENVGKIGVRKFEDDKPEVCEVILELCTENSDLIRDFKIIGFVNSIDLDLVIRKTMEVMTELHYDVYHRKSAFRKGERINYAGKVFDSNETKAAVNASLDFWLTGGKYSDQFENELARFLKLRSALLVNSGSSANLLAVAALTSPLLGEKRLRQGEEIITVAAGFPTTVAPILQNGLVPVFLDIKLPEYNIDVQQLELALSSKTRGVMIAHTLGNPFEVRAIMDFCLKHQLFLIEDNCDSLGSVVHIDGQERLTGTFGDIATSSFYPPHHITMGEGGAVYTNSPKIARAVASFRDWGRDCWCPTGKDNTCAKRFNWQLGDLPDGYDHKYIYSHLGYNLKATDIQAAIGCVQLKRINEFRKARIRNWTFLKNSLEQFSDDFILPAPTQDTSPSWFGFMVTIKENSKITRRSLIKFLEANNIQTRMLFSGNLIRQPCMKNLSDRGYNIRTPVDLRNSDWVMTNGFILGVYPGLGELELGAVVEAIQAYFKDSKHWAD